MKTNVTYMLKTCGSCKYYWDYMCLGHDKAIDVKPRHKACHLWKDKVPTD